MAVDTDQVRLMSKVAWMYYERDLKQAEMASRLHISQARVSRLLKQAVQQGIVRTSVYPPAGVHTELEAQIADRHQLTDVVLVTPSTDEAAAVHDLGPAGANYLSATLNGGEVLGVSSWSAACVEVARYLPNSYTQVATHVCQLVGGLGNPQMQVESTHLLDRLARATGAQPVFMPTPGILGAADAKQGLMADPAVASVTKLWEQLSVAMVGIGSIIPSELALRSGNALPEEVRAELAEDGAVGDILFRYFDADGVLVKSDLSDRVCGIEVEAFKAIPRRIGIAGGSGKREAIAAAVHGGWLTTLITDVDTGKSLLD